MVPMERELKLVLLGDEYDRLCDHLSEGAVRECRQSNSYWDTPDRRLTSEHVLLRLRIEDDRAFVTSKGRASIGEDGVFESTEDEESVDLEAAKRVQAGTAALRELSCGVVERLQLSGVELVCWGRVENTRRRYVWDDLDLEIDRTEFPGGVVEWEIELETDDPREVAGRVHGLLRSLSIPVRPQTRTKSERLRDQL